MNRIPSPVKHYGKRKLYRRKGGAVKMGGKSYSRHIVGLDRQQSARKSSKRSRYPQAYD